MNKLSTQNLNLLPDPVDLQRVCKSISALEAIICPEWNYRYYSYNKHWSDTEEFCEMRNGQGDQLLILFGNDGTCINGFAHESVMNGWKGMSIVEKKLFALKKEVKAEVIQEIADGVIDELPHIFDAFIFGEPIKSIGTTFCIWQTQLDSNWKIGNIEFPKDQYKDGSSDLLKLLDGKPETYKMWAEEYYDEEFEERKLKLNLVENIYQEAIITKEIVDEINPELDDIEKLKSDLDEIGYKYQL